MRRRAGIGRPARTVAPHRDQMPGRCSDRHLARGMGPEIPAAGEAVIARQPLDQPEIAQHWIERVLPGPPPNWDCG